MALQRMNPDTLHKNPVYSQLVVVEPGMSLVFVGGQNAVNLKGEVVADDLAGQTTQALKNLSLALEAGGAGWEDVIRMTLYIVQGQDLNEGFAAYQKFREVSENPPAVSMMFVAGLAHPKFLIEVDAIAAVKKPSS